MCLIQKQALVLGHLGVRHHLSGVPPQVTSTECGAVRDSSCPKVNLSASFTSRSVTTMALIHAGHLVATETSLLDRFAKLEICLGGGSHLKENVGQGGDRYGMRWLPTYLLNKEYTVCTP